MNTNTTVGQKLKSTINKGQDLEQRQNKLEAALKEYIATCKEPYRHPCAALVGELLGSNAHLAQERLEEMKETFLDVLILLTDPEVSGRLEKRGFSFLKMGEHFKRLLEFFDRANNRLCFAEMALYDVESYSLNERYLEGLENDFI